MVPIEMSEWTRRGPDNEPGLQDRTLDAATQEEAQKLSASGRLYIEERRSGLVLRATSYVGRIQLGELRITVRPKLQGAPLLTLLRYAYGLRDLHVYDAALFAAGTPSFTDLLIWQLAEEIDELLRRGLHRAYVRREEDLQSLRGHINVGEYARRGGVPLATLPCIHYPRQEDCLLNQVLLAGLRIGLYTTENLALRTRLRRLAGFLAATVSPLRLNEEVLSKALTHSDRRTAAYLPALRLVELILDEGGLAMDEAPELRLHGFLFDMNRFFQRLLSRFLHENLPGVSIKDEYGLRDVFSYSAEHNPQRTRAPRLRPDFALLEKGRVVQILDAKYRDLWEESLPREILYQLAVYALTGGAKRAIILYPTLALKAQEARLEIHVPSHGSLSREVVLVPPANANFYDLVSAKSGGETARQSFARELVYGQATPRAH